MKARGVFSWGLSLLVHLVLLLGATILPQPGPGARVQGTWVLESTPESAKFAARPKKKPATKHLEKGPEIDIPVQEATSTLPESRQESLSNSGVSQGSEKRIGNEVIQKVMARIESKLRYPISVRLRRISGLTILRLVSDAQGALLALTITKSSGSVELDELALQSVRDAAPFPELKALAMNLPIEFRLR